MKRRTYILSAVAIILIITAFFGGHGLKNGRGILKQFQSFSVTINNTSDFDIVSLEIGILKGTSKDILNKVIKSGETMKVKPELSVIGEGAIYMKYLNSKGAAQEIIVCGYTESAVGYSSVNISNDEVTVVEKCM